MVQKKKSSNRLDLLPDEESGRRRNAMFATPGTTAALLRGYRPVCRPARLGRI
jgi:hypothetical protein